MRRLFAHLHVGGELRKSEARYRTVLDAAFDAIVIITPEGIVRWFNRGAERIFGHRAEEVIGQPVTLLMPESYRDLCVAGLQRYLRTGEARVVGGTTELVGLRKDGSEFPMEMSLGETQEDGERLFTGVIRDITERKRAQDTLREAQDRFRSVFDHAPIGVAVVSLDGRYLQVNRALCEILGYPEEELQALTWQEIIHPDDLATNLAYAHRIKEGKCPKYHLDKRFRHADGHTVGASLNVSLVKDSEGEPLYFVSQIQDITKRKRAEEALDRLSHQHEMVLKSAGEGIFGLDLEGHTTFVNSTAANMTGWDANDLLGRSLHDTLHHTKPDGAPYPKEECPIYAAFTTGATHSRDDEVFWRKDGTSFPVEYVSTPIFEDGEIVGAVVTFRDITERKAIKEQLVLDESEIDPASLQLEITEGAMTTNGTYSTDRTLRNLKRMGVQLAIDDFGSGYSSLSYLKRFPVDFLKIDRSFIAGLGREPNDVSKDTEIVKAMIELTHALGLKVIAEGVETSEQLAQLRKMKCDFAQGNYFSEPLPSEELAVIIGGADLTD